MKQKSILGFCLLIILVFYRYATSRPVYKSGDRIRITARITAEPVVYDNSQRVKLLGLSFYLPKYPEVGYGDLIIVEGKVDGKSLSESKLIKLTKEEGLLVVFRQKVIDFYRQSLPEPDASLVAGSTLGSKSQIPVSFWESLKNAGVAHVVVASGLNVTLVAGFLLRICLLFLNRKKAVIVSIIGIWLYVLLAGIEAPVIRAAVMASFAFGAQGLGRLNSAKRGLALTALLMLVLNPSWISDVGFWLSSCATASILIFEKRVEGFFKIMPRIIKEAFGTAISAQIGVAPILYFAFGYISIWSPLINALVLWTVPAITIIGMIGGFIGVLVPNLGKILLWLIYPLTRWFVIVVSNFQFPYSI